jgi:hypothetical protein
MRQQGAGRVLSVVSKLTLKMLNVHTHSSPAHLKAKAAECRGMLPFVVKLLTPQLTLAMDRKGFFGTHLRRSCAALLAAYDCMREHGRVIPCAAFEDALLECAMAAVHAQVQMVPKFHFLCHIAEQVSAAGNPRFYATHLDESFNRDVVRIIQSCHIKDFGARVLAKLDLVELLQTELEELGFRATPGEA